MIFLSDSHRGGQWPRGGKLMMTSAARDAALIVAIITPIPSARHGRAIGECLYCDKLAYSRHTPLCVIISAPGRRAHVCGIQNNNVILALAGHLKTVIICSSGSL